MRKSAVLTLMMVLLLTPVVILIHGVGMLDVESSVREYCNSPNALKRYTPLTIGGNVKLHFTFDGRNLLVNVGNMHSEIVASVEDGWLSIKNIHLWEIFSIYCMNVYGEEYSYKARMYLTFALIGSISLTVIGLVILLNYLRKH